MSEAWTYFQREAVGGKSSCTICGVKISSATSTSGMWYHLQKAHGKSKTIKESGVQNITVASGAAKKRKISSFFQKESIGEVIAKLTAVDGFSFHGIIKSSFVRSAMTDKGYDFPKNHIVVQILLKQK